MQEQLQSETILSTKSEKVKVVEAIEKIANEKKIDIISAALELAKSLDWDPSWIAPYISGALKEKIRVEGEAQGLLKKTDNPKIRFE
jgi:Phage late-transcription coactivator